MTARIATLGMALILGTSAAPTLAADTTVTGRKLLIKDFTRPGTADRKMVFVSRDPAVVAAALGSAGDPTLNGGSLDLHNTAGSGESMTLPLPAGNWRARGSLYLYREVVSNPPAQDYKIKVVVKNGLLRGLVRDDVGSVFSYTLDEPSQGSVGVRVETGADRHCLDFGGAIRADESEDLGGSVYRGLFVAKEAPAPATCGSPSGAFLD